MFINDLKNYYSKLETKIIFPNPLNDIHKNTPIMSFNEERLNIVLSNPSHFNKKKKNLCGNIFCQYRQADYTIYMGRQNT